MHEKKIRIPAIDCEHCKRTIERELAELKGVTGVKVDVGSKTAVISWDDPLKWEEIVETLKEMGYPPGE